MSELRVTLHGDGLQKTIQLAQRLGDMSKVYPAFARAINHTGNVAKTGVYRTLAKQTGLKIGITRRAVHFYPASAGNLTGELTSRGGDVGLKYFGARETKAGVSAAPFNQRRVFPHTFFKGGKWPKRKALNMGGHVFDPDLGSNKWGRPFKKAKSGVIIPEQMTQGETLDVFHQTVEQRLPPRVMHEVKRLAGGLLG